MHKKTYLPSKICIVCAQPFSWRKKWERCWEETRYCSERCRRTAKARGEKRGKADPAAGAAVISRKGMLVESIVIASPTPEIVSEFV